MGTGTDIAIENAGIHAREGATSAELFGRAS